MQLKTFYLQDKFGNALPGALCYVYEHGTTTLVTTLRDADGQPLVNPVSADAAGAVQVAAPDGLYSVRTVAGVFDRTVSVQFIDHRPAALAMELLELHGSNVDAVSENITQLQTVAGNVTQLQQVAPHVAAINSAVGYLETIGQLDIAAQVEQARVDAQAAAAAIGPIHFFDTLAQAQSAASTLAEGDVIEINSDESNGGGRYRYVYAGGALVPKLAMDYTRRSILASAIGATIVGWQRDAVGAALRTLADKAAEAAITPEDFGAVAGEADSTAAISAAVVVSEMTGRWLSGSGRTYNCAGVVFGSGFKLRDITLINNGNADMLSVLQTRDTVLVRDVWFENVTVDGNRSTQTNVKGATTREDGGRHCVAIRGECENIYFKKCKLINSAGDGLLLFPYAVSTDFAVRNVVLEDCELSGNRRHGGSSDKTDGLYFIRCKLNNNGTDRASGFPANHGNTGDKNLSGQYYGNGFDIEEYHNSYGSRNIVFEDTDALNNARAGVTILRYSAPSLSTKFGNYKFIRGKYNKGVHPSTGGAIEVTPLAAAGTSGVHFGDVTLDGVDLGDGVAHLRACTARVTDVKSTATPTFIRALEYTTLITDVPNSAIYAASSATVKRIIQTPASFDVNDNSAITRGIGTTANIADAATTAQGVGNGYSFSAKDVSGHVRGQFRFQQHGDGPMRFFVTAGVGGAVDDYLTIRSDSTSPGSDNKYSLGVYNMRWSTVYSNTGTINTSDAREKTQPLPLDDAALDALDDVQIIAYQWLDSVAEKGAGARVHYGVIAQQVRDAFAAHGLDGCRYGLLCYDEWPEQAEMLDGDGNVIQECQAAGSRWGIRSDQLMFGLLSAQRREMRRIADRVAKLEGV